MPGFCVSSLDGQYNPVRAHLQTARRDGPCDRYLLGKGIRIALTRESIPCPYPYNEYRLLWLPRYIVLRVAFILPAMRPESLCFGQVERDLNMTGSTAQEQIRQFVRSATAFKFSVMRVTSNKRTSRKLGFTLSLGTKSKLLLGRIRDIFPPHLVCLWSSSPLRDSILHISIRREVTLPYGSNGRHADSRSSMD